MQLGSSHASPCSKCCVLCECMLQGFLFRLSKVSIDEWTKKKFQHEREVIKKKKGEKLEEANERTKTIQLFLILQRKITRKKFKLLCLRHCVTMKQCEKLKRKHAKVEPKNGTWMDDILKGKNLPLETPGGSSISLLSWWALIEIQ